MWKSRALTICGVMAALPLLGCAGGVTATSTQPSQAPTGYAEYQAPPYAPPPRLYRTSAAPAAVLVVLPGSGAWGADRTLWASEGFDVVTPPAAFFRLAAEQEEAMAQMMAAAERLAGAPVWVMGPPPEIEAALAAPGTGAEEISGIVETSAGGPAASCSESFSYFDPGNGTQPQVKVEKSGNCPPGAGFGIGGPAIAPAAPALRHNRPRVIEAAAAPETASPAARRAAVERLTELIKATPSS